MAGPYAVMALGICVALTAASASTVSAQGRSSSANQSAESGQRSTTAAGAPLSVMVTAASRLAGRDVRDMAGEDAGEVERILIDAATGKVSQILIGAGGFLGMGEELIAVPWHAIQRIRGDDEIRLRIKADALANAPRYSDDTLMELTRPVTLTQITNYYAPLMQDQNRDENNKESRSDGANRSAQNKAAQDSPKANQQAKNQTAGKQESGQQSGSGTPHFLVASDAVTMLAPPLMISANDIQGTNVVDRQGEDRGEIDQIMIDVDRGHVAYVLLERDGFLGMGGEWVPVPMAALKWVPGQTTGFVLEGSAAQLKEIPALERDELPTRVTGRDLQQLNQRFGVKPYWQEEQTASTEQSR